MPTLQKQKFLFNERESLNIQKSPAYRGVIFKLINKTMKNYTIEELKNQADIITIAERYGFTWRTINASKAHAKQNLLRDEKTSSLFFYPKSQTFKDFGSGAYGDVIELIQLMENKSKAEAIKTLKDLIGINNADYQPKKITPKPATQAPKKINLQKINYIAQKTLINKPTLYTKNENALIINPKYQKLLQTSKINPKYQKRLKFINSYFLGYSQYWQAPTILVRDDQNAIIDCVTYRPKSPQTGDEISNLKYHLFNFQRQNYFFTFRTQMEQLAKKKRFFIIGEGIKNALNALIYGVPFIAVEGAGNAIHLQKMKPLIDYYISKKLEIKYFFDGDKAGEKAHQIAQQTLNIYKKNIVNFDTNQDFMDFLTDGKND